MYFYKVMVNLLSKSSLAELYRKSNFIAEGQTVSNYGIYIVTTPRVSKLRSSLNRKNKLFGKPV